MGKGYRFQVKRGINTWLIVDTSIAKVKMYNDVVDTHTSRLAARKRCEELNAATSQGDVSQTTLAV